MYNYSNNVPAKNNYYATANNYSITVPYRAEHPGRGGEGRVVMATSI